MYAKWVLFHQQCLLTCLTFSILREDKNKTLLKNSVLLHFKWINIWILLKHFQARKVRERRCGKESKAKYKESKAKYKEYNAECEESKTERRDKSLSKWRKVREKGRKTNQPEWLLQGERWFQRALYHTQNGSCYQDHQIARAQTCQITCRA